MKLSEMVKGLPTTNKVFHAEKFEENGKSIVKFTLDFNNTKELNKKGKPITKAKKNAEYHLGKDIVNLTVPNEVLTALRLDKDLYASRKWFKADLNDENLSDVKVIRGKIALLRINMLFDNAVDKAKKATANPNVQMISEDAGTLLSKVDSLKEKLVMLLTGVKEDDELIEEF